MKASGGSRRAPLASVEPPGVLRPVLLAIAFVLLGAGQARADTTIGFDDLSPGTVVTTQYADSGGRGQGITFGPLSGVGDSARPVITTAGLQAHSGTQVADITCTTCNEGLGAPPDTTATFPTQRSHVSVYVGFLGSPAPLCTNDSTASTCAVVTLRAFDSTGAQVGASAPATLTQGAGVETLLSVSTSSPDIAGFEVSGRPTTDNDKDVAIDDVSFNAPSVPAPCTGVTTFNELVAALAACKTVVVANNASIDLAQEGYRVPGHPDEILQVPDGVTLESGRSPTVPGGMLYMSHPVSTCCGAGPFMLVLGNASRVSGLRLFGYDPSDTTPRGDGTAGILIQGVADVVVDNDEIAGWPGAGVAVADTNNHLPIPSPGTHLPSTDYSRAASRVRITNDYFHNNVQCEAGYGVVVGDNALALIDRNVFDFDRHDVSGGHASPGASYIARWNFILTDGPTCGGAFNQHFDMHGSNGGWNGGPAGQYIDIRNNTIRGAQHYNGNVRPAFELRGTPTDRAIFADNAVEHEDDGAAVQFPHHAGVQPAVMKGRGELFIYGNAHHVNTSQQLAVGDFDGDGCSDVFQSVGTVWVYSPCGSRIWRFLNASRLGLSRLAFGDFNGDGKTDVFTQQGDRWLVYYGGTGPPTPLPAGSGIPMKDYRFGDLDGDGRTDVFRANGNRFYYSSAGATQWKPLASSHLKIGELRLCDFNGDGKADVFSLANHQWSVSYGGATEWRRLNRELSSNLGELVFADFDGDGRCDVTRFHDHSLQVSWNGIKPWHGEPLGYQESASGTLVGDFLGDKRAGLLEFAYHGHPLTKFRLSTDFGPLRGWSRQNIL